MDEKGTPHTRDNTMPTNGDEYLEGMLISVVLGVFYTMNAYMPILMWYLVRKDDILGMKNNDMYKFSWYTLYALHFFVFLPLALLWPFTYIGSSVIVDFYDVANWYVGTVGAFIVFITVTALWALSAILYESNTYISSSYIWQEMLLYLVIEVFAWYTTVWEYPKAHRQFYYAYYIEIAEENKPQSKEASTESEDEEEINEDPDGVNV